VKRSIAAAAIALAVAMPSAAAQPNGEPKLGYWWYAPKPAEPGEADEDQLPPAPVIPPMTELARWSPPRIAKLITEQRDYAATVLTVDAVADFWRLQDFARRKARAFAGVTQLAMLTHPELSARSAYPVVGDARDAMGAQKDATRRAYLRSKGGEFALIMFSRASCGYCRVQWPILQRFQEEMGWQVSSQNLDRKPELSSRFGVDVTPTTMVIRRGSSQRMVIANGVEAYPNLIQTAYQAVKLLSGDIRPEQFLTGAGEENGFFDALANGPVAANDPAVSQSAQP
jgi:conjugal transfer pilus assembly protein TraF